MRGLVEKIRKFDKMLNILDKLAKENFADQL